MLRDLARIGSGLAVPHGHAQSELESSIWSGRPNRYYARVVSGGCNSFFFLWARRTPRYSPIQHHFLVWRTKPTMWALMRLMVIKTSVRQQITPSASWIRRLRAAVPTWIVLLYVALPAAGQVGDGAERALGPIEGPSEGPINLKLEPTEPWAALEILGTAVEPGSKRRLVLRSSESFAGGYVETPVVALRGTLPGPTLCLVAGIHGDEVNGVEIVRRTLQDESLLDTLEGSIVAVPIANLSAFQRGSRYLPDRRDLNRYFPGRTDGSSASRIAFRLFDNVIRKCDALVDLHTGSFHRTNIHQVRADMSNARTAELANAYGAEIIVSNDGREGTLRRAATDSGIPAITVEAGEPARFDEQLVRKAVKSISRLIFKLGMSSEASLWSRLASPSITYWDTGWVRCNTGGILVSQVELGETVELGQLLGTVSDPVSDEVDSIRARRAGRIIGMALDQLVMPGFAAYHIASREPASAPALPPMSTAETREEPEGIDLEERPE